MIWCIYVGVFIYLLCVFRDSDSVQTYWKQLVEYHGV